VGGERKDESRERGLEGKKEDTKAVWWGDVKAKEKLDPKGKITGKPTDLCTRQHENPIKKLGKKCKMGGKKLNSGPTEGGNSRSKSNQEEKMKGKDPEKMFIKALKAIQAQTNREKKTGKPEKRCKTLPEIGA